MCLGYCTDEQYRGFLRVVPETERVVVQSGITLIKYWLEVSQEEQSRRFEERIHDGRKTWKLSPQDLEAHRRWYDYSRARDAMFAATDTLEAPWYVIDADDQKRARLNCIAHLLSQIPYEEIPSKPVKLPKRQDAEGYVEPNWRRHPFQKSISRAFSAISGRQRKLAARRQASQQEKRDKERTMATTTEPGATAAGPVWHTLSVSDALQHEEVDPTKGLSPAEAETRLQKFGPNAFAQAEKEPGWRAFLRQFRDPMQIVLLVAGAVSGIAIQQWGTAIVLFGLALFNAVLALRQEGKAEASVAALQKMLLVKTRVRRGGEMLQIPADQVVPGDIVLVEAGDRVPADGRLINAATLEIDESALTGESAPVPKQVDAVSGVETPLGDRVDMAYMNTNVTRGSGEILVTATGMSTEVGHISGLLQATRARRDAAHEAAQHAYRTDYRDRRDSAGHLHCHRLRARGAARHPLPDRRRLRHRGHPNRLASRRHVTPRDWDDRARHRARE